MSALRHRYRIVVDGEPHEITTNARDLAAVDVGTVELDDAGVNRMRAGAEWTWQLLHAACLRLELPGIPGELDKFVDLLDDIDDLEPAAGELVDPTRPAGSAGSP